jgi:hypothetical protein
MLQVSADMADDGSFEWKLTGAPPKCVVEVRLQNTINGSNAVSVVETDANGNAPIAYKQFGQHVSINVRVLNEEQQNTVHSLVYDSATTDTHLSLSANEDVTPESLPLSVSDETLVAQGEVN